MEFMEDMDENFLRKKDDGLFRSNGGINSKFIKSSVLGIGRNLTPSK